MDASPLAVSSPSGVETLERSFESLVIFSSELMSISGGDFMGFSWDFTWLNGDGLGLQ